MKSKKKMCLKCNLIQSKIKWKQMKMKIITPWPRTAIDQDALGADFTHNKTTWRTGKWNREALLRTRWKQRSVKLEMASGRKTKKITFLLTRISGAETELRSIRKSPKIYSSRATWVREETITKFKKAPYGERLSTKFYQQRTLRSEAWTKNTSPPPTKRNKKNESCPS